MNKKARQTYLIVILICIVVLIFFCKLQKQESKQDDIIFFKLFGQEKQSTSNEFIDGANIEKNDNIVFDMSKTNEEFKTVDFLNTIRSDISVKEKVAPGSSGNFFIEIISNKDIKYKIKFQSENEKPKNLMFNVEGSDNYYYNLEELEQELEVFIKKDCSKKIKINWKWNYEESNDKNKQDTEDGMKIKYYNFKIYVLKEL